MRVETETIRQGNRLVTRITTPYPEPIFLRRKRTDAISDKDVLRERATTMLTTLRIEKSRLRGQIIAHADTKGERQKDRVIAALAAVDEGETVEGIDTQYMWSMDIVDHMLRGKQLEIGTSLATSSRVYENRSTKPVLSVTDEYRVGMSLVALLRKLTPGTPPRLLARVNDISPDFNNGSDYSAVERRELLGGIQRILREEKLFDSDAKKGTDFVLLPDSTQRGNFKRLVVLLEASNAGSVVREAGNIYFKAHKWFASLLGKTKGASLIQDRLYLQFSDDYPLDAALIAAGLLDQGEGTMHLSLVDMSFKNPQQDAYAFLRASSITHQEDHHTLYFAPELYPPELITYNIAGVLERSTEEFLHYLDKDIPFEHMAEHFGYQYIKENYGKDVEGKGYEGDILPADTGMIKYLIDHMHEIVPKGGFRKSINIGNGPFNYLNQLFSPFVEEMVAFEPSGPMRDVAIQWKEGTLPDEYNVGPKFEEFMTRYGRGNYRESERLAKRKITITDKGIADAALEEHDLDLEGFTSCSIARTKQEFWKYIKLKAQGLKKTKDSRMVALHMVGSKGWDGFPAVNLSRDDIQQAYLDAGLEITHFEPFMKEKSSDAATREGYDGMCVIVARPII